MKISINIKEKTGSLELRGHINAMPALELKVFLNSITGENYEIFIVDLTRARSITTSGTGLIYSIKNKLDDLEIPFAFVGNKDEIKSLNPDFTVDKSIPCCENHGKALITLRNILFHKRLASERNS